VIPVQHDPEDSILYWCVSRFAGIDGDAQDMPVLQALRRPAAPCAMILPIAWLMAVVLVRGVAVAALHDASDTRSRS